MASIKGALLRARLEGARAVVGDEATRAALERLDSADRRVVEGVILPSALYPASLLLALDEALVAEVHGGDGDGALALFDEIGAHGARQHARSIYRVFQHEADVERLLSVATNVFAKFHAGVPAEASIEAADSRSRVTVRSATATPHGCRATLAYFREVVAACTELEVAVVETRCRARGDAACELDLRWGVAAAAAG